MSQAVDSPKARSALRPGVQIHVKGASDAGAAMAETVPPWHRAELKAESQRIEVDSIDLGSLGGPRRRGAGDRRSAFLAYAGLGMGKLKLSMDLDNGNLKLGKEKHNQRSRLFLGMRYRMAPRTSLALEYRAMAGDGSLFEFASLGLILISHETAPENRKPVRSGLPAQAKRRVLFNIHPRRGIGFDPFAPIR